MKNPQRNSVWPPLHSGGHLQYRPVEAVDISTLAANLRPIDHMEMQVRGPGEPLARIELAVASSSESWALHAGDELIAVFGVSRYKTFDSPWLLATDKADALIGRLLQDAKAWIRSMKRDGIPLGNVVWKENAASIRWLQRLGFTFHDEMPKLNGEPSGLLEFTLGLNRV